MVELFSIINTERAKSVKIECTNISYWRSDRVTNLVNYITEHMEEYIVDKFYVEPGYVYDDEYVKAFDIELYMSEESYKELMERFQGTIAKYNKYEVDISLYEHKWE